MTAAFEAARQHPPNWRALLKRIIPLVIAGAAIYQVQVPALRSPVRAHDPRRHDARSHRDHLRFFQQSAVS